MINAFKNIGEYLLESKNEEARKNEFLNALTIIPYEPSSDKEKDIFYEIVFNLNTKSNIIEIKIGEELSRVKRHDFMGFSKTSPNSKKIAFVTNNYANHIFLTVPDIINYVKINLKMDKQYTEFVAFLKNLRDTFYIKEIYKSKNNKENTFFYLNFNLLSPNVGKIFNKYYKSVIDKDGIKKPDFDKKKKILENSFKDCITKLLNIPDKEFKNLNIFSLKIDDKYIHQTQFKKEYFDVIYHQKFLSYFNNVKKNKLCFLCNEKKVITGDIDIPTKFYMTDKKYFFENGETKNAYKSFGICKECYQDIKVGISYISEKLSDSLFGMNYYLIPSEIYKISNIESKYRYIIDKLKSEFSGVEKNFRKQETLIEEFESEQLKFDFLFYYTHQAAFKVIELISDIKFKDIRELLDTFNDIKYEYADIITKINLNMIYFLLFPSFYTQKNVDSKLFRKELVLLLNNILKRRRVSFEYLIKKFIFIFKKTYFYNNNNEVINFLLNNPLRMNILLTLFSKLDIIKIREVDMKDEKFIDIEDEEIKKFFSVHKDIYENDNHKQGLVLLGVLINSLLNAQKNKSATFLNKLNFDGIKPNRIPKLINEITEYLNIYTYGENKSSLFSLKYKEYQVMMDRLQGIEMSKLKPDEVLFYILSGISLGRYIGYKYSKNKPQEGGENNE